MNSELRPSGSDIDRLITVAEYHKARAVVLVEWKKGQELQLYELVERQWKARNPSKVFQ